MRPIDAIDELKKIYVNTDLDWERLLEFAYRELLDADSWVIDIGGHGGRHADVFISEIGCARVAVVEPLPDHAAALEARYRCLSGVSVHACAIGRERGRTSFIFNAGSPEESGIRERRYNQPDAAHLVELEVELLRLDDLCADWERLDFVKVDTEGGEVDILAGGEETLRRLRPVVSVEYGAAGYQAYGHSQGTLFERAAELDYGLLDLFGNAIPTLEEWSRCSDNFYWDYLMVPNESRARVGECLSGQWGRVREVIMPGAHDRIRAGLAPGA